MGLVTRVAALVAVFSVASYLPPAGQQLPTMLVRTDVFASTIEDAENYDIC